MASDERENIFDNGLNSGRRVISYGTINTDDDDVDHLSHADHPHSDINGSVGFNFVHEQDEDYGEDDDDGDEASGKKKKPPPSDPFPCWPALSRRLSGVSCLSITNMMLICLVTVGYGMCFSLFSPFFPNEASKKGMSPTVVGILFGAYELVMFIGSPISGKAVTHLGLRYMLGAGTLLAGGATMLFGIVDESPNGLVYIILCFAVRIVEACGASLYLAASYCVAGNMFPANIAFIYSLMETANGIGSMIGPSAGGLLYAIGGFYLPFVVTGAVLLLFGFTSTVLLPATAVSGDGGDDEESKIPWSRLFLVSPEAWIIGLTEATSAILSNFPEPTISIYFEYLGLKNPAFVGAVFLASSIVYTIVCVIVGHLSDKYPDQVYPMMSLGGIIAAFSFFIMGPPPFVDDIITPAIWMTATAEITLYVGIALLLVPVPRALMNVAKDAGFSEGMGMSALVATLYNGLWFMGGFCGPPVAGFLLETVGFQWGAAIMGLVSLLLTALLLFAAAYRRFGYFVQRRQFNYGMLDEEESEAASKSGEDEGVDVEFDPSDPVTVIRRASSVSSFHARFPGRSIYVVSQA